jgi:hypothetical protein
MKPHRIPSRAKIDRNAEICDRAEAGESVAELARAYLLSRIRIQQILHEHPLAMSAHSAAHEPRPQIEAWTELNALPISSRLKRACDLQEIRTVADLHRGARELRGVGNIGDRTMLEVSEILREAGLLDFFPDLVALKEPRNHSPQQSKRAMLRASSATQEVFVGP